jgi:uncharacterized protein (TIGR01777 family)
MRRDDAPLSEGSAPGTDFLAALTVFWEQAACPAAARGVRVSHPRMGHVLGIHGGILAKMLTPFRSFVGGPLGDGTQMLSWVHVEDATRALLFAIDGAGERPIAGPFNVAAPNAVTMNDFAHALGAALGRPSALRVPALALKIALGDGLAEAVLTGQRAVPQKLLDHGFAFHFPTLDAAFRDLFALEVRAAS